MAAAEAWARQEKVRKFVDQQLKPDLANAIAQRDKVFEQQKTFLDLKRNIEILERNGVTSMRSMVNLGRRSSKSRGRRNPAGNRADAMKTGGNRRRRVRARRKRVGIDRIYAVARQTSRSRAFTTGAGRCSFTERGEEKRRRRRWPCFLASSWLLESTRGPFAPHL
ncbi:uncharacterized protein [Miscanthus floridulus]|uniref:uncharacterized protein n=1 Tax=Miscanthus floridulus TaxID=154761 RepID=UPI00345AEE8B